MKLTISGAFGIGIAIYVVYRILRASAADKRSMDVLQTETLDAAILKEWADKHAVRFTAEPAVVSVLIDPNAVGDTGLLNSLKSYGDHGIDGWSTFVQAFYDQKDQQILLARFIRFVDIESKLRSMLDHQNFQQTGITILQTGPATYCEI